jgi:hypothetical protein
MKITTHKSIRRTLEATESLCSYVQYLIDEDVTKGSMFRCQNKAFKMFGRANVELWRRTGKVKAYYRGTKRVEYKMSELLKAAAERQSIEL